MGSAPTAEPNRDKGKWSGQNSLEGTSPGCGRNEWTRMMQAIKGRAAAAKLKVGDLTRYAGLQTYGTRQPDTLLVNPRP